MKPLYSLLFLAVFLSVKAQNYKMIGAADKKLFTTYPSATKGYSLSIDSVLAAGGDSVYYNFFALRDTMVPSNCTWWGGPQCTTQDNPVWAGQIFGDNTGAYRFVTRFNDTLHFNFNLNMGDTSVFFEDATQKFSSIYDDNDTMTILGIADSVKVYTVRHTDLSGNVISSPLNGTQLVVSENNGLVNFFRIDSFPQILTPLKIIGNSVTASGFYQLTNEIVYDYQPGDEIQTHHQMSQSGGPPWNNYNYYQKHTILSRTLTVDSIKYLAIQTKYDAAASTSTIDTVWLQYHRPTVIAEIPFEKYDANKKTLYVGDYCGSDRWTFRSILDPGTMFCPEEKCWGPYDTGGPPVNTDVTYVAGVGLYNVNSYKFAPPPNGFSSNVNIVFFKKNGVDCGTEVVLGIEDLYAKQDFIKVSPNPSGGSFSVSAPEGPLTLTIYTAEGKQIRNELISNGSTLNFTLQDEGIYFAHFTFNGVRSVKKLVVLK